MMEVDDIQVVVEQMIASGQGILVGLLIGVIMILGIVVLIIFQNDAARWKGRESSRTVGQDQEDADHEDLEILRLYENVDEDADVNKQ